MSGIKPSLTVPAAGRPSLCRAGIARLAACTAPALLAVEAAAATFYVSPKGNDARSGTHAARNDGPLATLDGARLKVRAHRTQGATGPVTVLIRDGEPTDGCTKTASTAHLPPKKVYSSNKFRSVVAPGQPGHATTEPDASAPAADCSDIHRADAAY